MIQTCALAFVLFVAIITPVSAREDNPNECGGNRSIYFANGIGVVSRHDAKESLEDVIDLLSERVSDDVIRTTHFSLAYNRSASKVTDAVESAAQILGNEYPSLLVAILLRIGDVPGFLVPPSLKLLLNEYLRTEWARKLFQSPGSRSDVADHVNSYLADIARGRKVVVVAHSQGNLFSNLAFEEIGAEQQRSFGVIPVASPDSIARGMRNGHRTFFNDLVIDLVIGLRFAAGLPPPLLPNDFAASPQTNWIHLFSDDYLSDSSARVFIADALIRTLADLPTPSTNACAPKSVTLDIKPLPSNVSIAGWPIFISGSITNRANSDQTNLGLQSWISQGELTIAAGGGLLVPNGWSGNQAELGVVRSSKTLELDTFYSQANAGFALRAGMTPGPAKLKVELRKAGSPVDTQVFDIVIDRSPTSMALARPQTGSWSSSPQSLYVVSYGATVIYYSMVNTYDGSTPRTPSAPSPSSNNGSLVGPADGFTLFALNGQNKRSKLRFVGCSSNGCGPVSPVFSYTLDLR